MKESLVLPLAPPRAPLPVPREGNVVGLGKRSALQLKHPLKHLTYLAW